MIAYQPGHQNAFEDLVPDPFVVPFDMVLCTYAINKYDEPAQCRFR